MQDATPTNHGPIIVGIVGKMGAGKSTLARNLQAHLALETKPFAAYLKDMMRSIGVPEENLTGTQEQKGEKLDILCGQTARHAMQTLGTEWRDTIGRDLWTNLWMRDLPQAGAIADDVRFCHEARRIRDLGGVIVKIQGEVRKPTLKRKKIGPQHKSEAEVDEIPFDLLVTNHFDPELIAEQSRVTALQIRRLAGLRWSDEMERKAKTLTVPDPYDVPDLDEPEWSNDWLDD